MKPRLSLDDETWNFMGEEMNRYGDAQIREYICRINRVLDYLDNHLDEVFNIGDLARIAGFSPFHFHRIFSAMLGETLFSFLGRLRLEKAARILCGNLDVSVTETALKCGFSSPAAFSRAFKESFGVSPSGWRKRHSILSNGDSNLYQALRNTGNARRLRLSYDQVIDTVRRAKMEALQGEVNVSVLEKMTVAYVRHIGPYAGDEELFQRLFEKLYAWAVPRGLADTGDPGKNRNIVVYHDDPGITEPEKLRISVGIVVPPDTGVSGEIGRLYIPSTRYAMGRFLLSGQEYGEAWQYMCGVWMPASGYQPDEGYCFEMYRHNPEAEKLGKCDTTICVPVKPL